MMTTLERPAWMLRWPATVDRIEILNGKLSFGISDLSGQKDLWDDADLAAARAAYPDHEVSLSASRVYIFVGPPKATRNAATTLAGARTESLDETESDRGKGAGADRQGWHLDDLRLELLQRHLDAAMALVQAGREPRAAKEPWPLGEAYVRALSDGLPVPQLADLARAVLAGSRWDPTQPTAKEVARHEHP